MRARGHMTSAARWYQYCTVGPVLPVKPSYSFLSGFLPFGYQAHIRKAKELRAQQEQLSAELEKARGAMGGKRSTRYARGTRPRHDGKSRRTSSAVRRTRWQ